MIDPLEGIRLKILRAATIINDLDGRIIEFAQREPYSVHIDEKPDEGGSLVGTLTAVKNPEVRLDPNIVLMAGEALYQLRSSLDHCVHQLVLLNNPGFDIQKKGRLQFPIFKCGSAYGTRAGGMIKGVTHLESSLIEREQPYNRFPNSPEDDVLWCLSELNNTDKHRIIPTTTTMFGTLTARAGGEVLFYVDGPVDLEEDKVILSPYVRNWTHDKVEAEIYCSVAFQQCRVIRGTRRDMKELLWMAWARVSSLIDRIVGSRSGVSGF